MFIRWVGLVLIALISVFMFLFGLLYISTPNMLPFHAAAVPEGLRDDMLPLYLALMKLIGAPSMAIGLASFFLTFGYIRQGSGLVLGLVTAMLVGPILVAAYVAETLAAETGAPTSWHIMGILIATTVAGAIMVLFGHRR